LIAALMSGVIVALIATPIATPHHPVNTTTDEVNSTVTVSA
jgi:hypothetical protein